MASRLFNAIAVHPRIVLVVTAITAISLSVLALTSIDRVEPEPIVVPGSESAATRDGLAEVLGYDPVPAIEVVLRSPEGLADPASDVVIGTLVDATEAVDGVGAVTQSPPSPNQMTIVLQIHFPADVGLGVVERAADELVEVLDPGVLEISIGGEVPARLKIRDQLAEDAPRQLLIAVPLALLLLAGVAGLRLGLVAALSGLLGAGLATGVCLAAAALGTLAPAALVAAAVVGAVLGIETSLVLTARYREEAAILGPGNEAIEYSLAASGVGYVLGAALVVATGLALGLLGVEPVAQIGFGIAAAGLLAPLAGVVTTLAALTLGIGGAAGESMPMVSNEGAPENAGIGFRVLVGLAGSKIRALAVIVVVVAATVVSALSLADAEVIDFSPLELAGSEVADAAEEITTDFSAGALAPIVVALEGPPEAPTSRIYRDALSAIEGVAEVGSPLPAGSGSIFEVSADTDPLSVGGQAVTDRVRSLEDSTDNADFTGAPVALDDATDELSRTVPLAVIALLLAASAAVTVVLRTPYAPALVVVGLLPAVAAIGLTQTVFGEGLLTGPLDYEARGAPHLSSMVLIAGVLVSIGLFRSAFLGAEITEERSLGAGVRGALARAGALTIVSALAAGLIGAAFAGAWVGSDVLSAKEVAFGLAVGLLADSIIVRPLLAPAVARLLLRG